MAARQLSAAGEGAASVSSKSLEIMRLVDSNAVFRMVQALQGQGAANLALFLQLPDHLLPHCCTLAVLKGLCSSEDIYARMYLVVRLSPSCT
jgi:hypothetical protein